MIINWRSYRQHAMTHLSAAAPLMVVAVMGLGVVTPPLGAPLFIRHSLTRAINKLSVNVSELRSNLSGTFTQFITASTSWSAKTDGNSIIVECVGGGGGAFITGGGGGEYRKSTISYVPSTSIALQVGTGGGATTGSSGLNGGDSIFDTALNIVVAKGGQGGGNVTGGTGGSSGVGTIGYNGGNGGLICGGGGGAGGPSGAGGNGGMGNVGGFMAGGGGGGNGGGSNGQNNSGFTPGPGGNNALGSGGGTGGNPGTDGGGASGSFYNNPAPAGGNGIEWDVTHGSGGGGGGAGGNPSSTGGNAGLYGAGGGGVGGMTTKPGDGANGIIAITWSGEMTIPSIDSMKVMAKPT